MGRQTMPRQELGTTRENPHTVHMTIPAEAANFAKNVRAHRPSETRLPLRPGAVRALIAAHITNSSFPFQGGT